jgi:hypothetical protein
VAAAAAVLGWLRARVLSRRLARVVAERDRLRDELDAAGRKLPPAVPRLRVTRPTGTSRGDAEWYEFEVLVSNLSEQTLHGIAVTAFVGGRQAGETTNAAAIPPGRGVAFNPRVPRPEVLNGPLSIRAGNSETEAWWRPAP